MPSKSQYVASCDTGICAWEGGAAHMKLYLQKNSKSTTQFVYFSSIRKACDWNIELIFRHNQLIYAIFCTLTLPDIHSFELEL